MLVKPWHHHESLEVRLLKISARATLPFCHLKMVLFFFEIQDFHLTLPSLFTYYVYFMMICFLDLLL